MSSIEEHVRELAAEIALIRKNCPWLDGAGAGGGYTQYGEKGALCGHDQKSAAGRASSAAYGTLRHLEFDHLADVRRVLREELSKRRSMDEETGRFLAKDLFEKCEQVTSCIGCECDTAVSAYHNLSSLVEILGNPPT